MQTVTVAALRAFEHHGRSYRRGESVHCSALDASILGRQGMVSLVKGESGTERDVVESVPAFWQSPNTPEPQAQTQTYRTNDLSVDDPAPPVTPKRKRTYKRRDLVADPT